MEPTITPRKTGRREFTMDFDIVCPCCGTVVTATDPGFTATTVEVAACPTQRGLGILTVTMRKSAAVAAYASVHVLAHRDGLVTFA